MFIYTDDVGYASHTHLLYVKQEEKKSGKMAMAWSVLYHEH